jgi:hypothetical protein
LLRQESRTRSARSNVRTASNPINATPCQREPMAPTIQNVVDTMIAAVPGAPWSDSVDAFKAGDPAQPVTGVVMTFTATMAVLRRAVALGADLIVPTSTFTIHSFTFA